MSAERAIAVSAALPLSLWRRPSMSVPSIGPGRHIVQNALCPAAAVCAENLIRVGGVRESAILAA